MTFQDLENAITRAHRAGDFALVDDLETERDRRRAAARDRWADEAHEQRTQQADRRKYGGFYGRSK